jgi:hypothetical protein
MPLLEHKTFNFSQYFIFDLNKCDGWCAGISVALILHLQECFPGYKDNYPLEEVFSHAKDYADMLRSSFSSYENKSTLGSSGLRESIEKFQRLYEKDAGTPGSWEYDFSRRGVFLINLKASETHQAYGSQYISRYNFWSSSDHAGMLVTGEGNRFFVFDPNAGGGIFSWSQCREIPNIKSAIDKALDILYKKNDRLRGQRIVRLNAAKRLDYGHSRYKHPV